MLESQVLTQRRRVSCEASVARSWPLLPNTSCEFPLRFSFPLSRCRTTIPAQGGGCMAIYRLLQRHVFEPDDVRMPGLVYEDVLKALGLVDRNDPATELIAKRLIEVAKAGERDPQCLKDLTIEVLQKEACSGF